MTSKNLTARQTRWTESRPQISFQIKYRPSKQNASADALTLREQDVGPQEDLKIEIRYKPVLTAPVRNPSA